MKRLFILFFSLVAFYGLFAQNATVKGRILGAGKPLIKAQVNFIGDNNVYLSTETNLDGIFVFKNVPSGNYQLYVSAEGYEDYFSENEIKVSENSNIDLGDINMQPSAEQAAEEELPVVSEEELSSSQGEENIVGLLHGARNIFLSAAAYNLGQFRYRIRGYDGRYSEVLINGITMNNMENGYAYWSNWGGLNNVTRYKEPILGLNFADYTFGNIGGETNITMLPASFRKGIRLTYSSTNRTYRNRAMFTYSTGLMSNNWALTISGSYRWAKEGYVPGTFYDVWAYYLGLEKKLGKHDIILNVFGVPYRRGKQGAALQEAYDLAGTHYYNPYWGYQNGKKRNSRIANYHKPTLILTDIFNLSEKTKITTSFAARVGRAGSSALNWYNAPDPRPDYYRYLPSYITNEESAQIVADSFASPNYGQINWDELYEANRNSTDIIYDANGIKGNIVKGHRAQYIVEERRFDQRYFAFSSYLNHQINDNLSLDAGIQLRYFKTKNYKKLLDLLGADFWLDIDKYAEREVADMDSAQNDLDHPNRLVKEGDIFGYNYDANIRDGKLWAQTTYDISKLTIGLAAFVSYTMFWRTGHMRNGKFPENSYGNSPKQKFFNYGLKSSFTFKINGRNYIFAHGAYLTLPPTFRNSYISPRTRDFTVDGLTSEKILSADFGYTLRAPKIKATLDLFYTQFKNQTRVVSFYHDGYRNFVNYAMTGIDKVHQGIEGAIEANVYGGLWLYLVGSKGFYQYTSRPKVTITVDNTAEVLAQDKTVYIKNYFVEGTPQTALSAGFRYRSPKYWFFSGNFNYIDDNYLSFNPERRTSDAVAYIPQGSEQWYKIIAEEKLPAAYTLDASIGKSWKIKHKYYVFVSLNLNNILNNKNIITGGYEQLRFDMRTKDPDKFPPKYYYLYGRQYFLNLILSF